MNDTPDRTGPRPDPTQGAQQGRLTPGQLTRADLAGKSLEWIEAQRVAGRLDDLLAGRPQP